MCTTRKGGSGGAIAGAVIGAIFFLICLFVVYKMCCQGKEKVEDEAPPEPKE
jgi:Ca2+/Na+ antiporter